jgi:hypothetical protein
MTRGFEDHEREAGYTDKKASRATPQRGSIEPIWYLIEVPTAASQQQMVDYHRLLKGGLATGKPT